MSVMFTVVIVYFCLTLICNEVITVVAVDMLLVTVPYSSISVCCM